jgi:hypothetical protein
MCNLECGVTGRRYSVTHSLRRDCRSRVLFTDSLNCAAVQLSSDCAAVLRSEKYSKNRKTRKHEITKPGETTTGGGICLSNRPLALVLNIVFLN